MPGAFEGVDALDDRAGVGEIARREERQHRRELLARKRMIVADAVLLDHQDARLPGRDGAPGGAIGTGRLGGALARSRVADWPITAGDSLPSGHIKAASVAFCDASTQNGAPRRERREQPRTYRIDDDKAVLRRAAGGVVEGLGAQDAFGGGLDVGGLVDDAGDVAGADAEGRRAAGVGGAHVGLRAGGDDEVGEAHEVGRRALGHRRGQHLHQVARQLRRHAGALELGMDVADQSLAGAPAFRRRRDDDGVAAFQRIDDLVRRRRPRDWSTA